MVLIFVIKINIFSILYYYIIDRADKTDTFTVINTLN